MRVLMLCTGRCSPRVLSRQGSLQVAFFEGDTTTCLYAAEASRGWLTADELTLEEGSYRIVCQCTDIEDGALSVCVAVDPGWSCSVSTAKLDSLAFTFPEKKHLLEELVIEDHPLSRLRNNLFFDK